jgi:hypothetical protein
LRTGRIGGAAPDRGYVGARRCERERHGLSDPAVGAGDKRNSSAQIEHHLS